MNTIVMALRRGFIAILVLAASAMLFTPVSAADNEIIVLNVKGTINPVLTDYIERGIGHAEAADARMVIISLDTPGGLDTAIRNIIQAIDRSSVPVVVYVPPGARAASAGFFITIASDVAVMAPDTAIGAATPVSVGGDEDGLSDDMRNKVINDAVAYARAIATAHDRNPDWAESAVRDGASLPAPEALEQGVIDLIANDFTDLMAQLDGFQYRDVAGNLITLSTAGANVTDFDMTAVEAFLYTIADPNIAYLLLTLAMLGIMVEIFNPGLIFPGTVGVISGILAFLSLGMMPVNYAGIILMVVAFGLFIAEALTPTFGLLTVAGAAALITGSLILFKEGGPLFEVDIWLVVAVTLVLAAITVMIATTVVKTYRRKVSAGIEDMSGRKAVVRTPLAPSGTVFLEGEIWSADIEDGKAEPGEEVVVTRVDGLHLIVRKEKSK